MPTNYIFMGFYFNLAKRKHPELGSPASDTETYAVLQCTQTRIWHCKSVFPVCSLAHDLSVGAPCGFRVKSFLPIGHTHDTLLGS